LTLEDACKLPWDLFEALVAEIFERESERVILTSRGRDHGADVVVVGHESGDNILVQVKATSARKLDSEQAVREVDGSARYFEDKLGLKFSAKNVHSNARAFSRRTRSAAKIYAVTLAGEDWLKKSLKRHQIRVADIVARNALRVSV